MTQFLRLQDGIRITEFSMVKILLSLFETFGIDFNFTKRPGKAKYLLLEILLLFSFSSNFLLLLSRLLFYQVEYLLNPVLIL